MPSTSSAPTSSCPTTCCSAPSWRPRPPGCRWSRSCPTSGPCRARACRRSVRASRSPRACPVGAATPRCATSVNALFRRGLPPLNAARTARGLPPLRSFYDQVLDTEPDPRADQPELRLRVAIRSRQRQLHRSRSSTSRRGPSRGPTRADRPSAIRWCSSASARPTSSRPRCCSGSSMRCRRCRCAGSSPSVRCFTADDVTPSHNVDGHPVGAARPDPA